MKTAFVVSLCLGLVIGNVTYAEDVPLHVSVRASDLSNQETLGTQASDGLQPTVSSAASSAGTEEPVSGKAGKAFMGQPPSDLKMVVPPTTQVTDYSSRYNDNQNKMAAPTTSSEDPASSSGNSMANSSLGEAPVIPVGVSKKPEGN